jgi:dienelactone hydrolase
MDAQTETFQSRGRPIRIQRFEPQGSGPRPALLLAHGSGGAVTWWLDRFAPALARLGIALYAPHYFDSTGTTRATAETILDGRHFPVWLQTLQDAVAFVRSRPSVDPQRIGVLGISLGAYLAVALGLDDPSLRLVIELSGGIPPGWEHRIAPAMPPVLILHGAADSIVPVSEAQKLERLLKAGGAPYQIEIFPGENHWFSAASFPRLLMICGSFLARHL